NLETYYLKNLTKPLPQKTPLRLWEKLPANGPAPLDLTKKARFSGTEIENNKLLGNYIQHKNTIPQNNSAAYLLERLAHKTKEPRRKFIELLRKKDTLSLPEQKKFIYLLRELTQSLLVFFEDFPWVVAENFFDGDYKQAFEKLKVAISSTIATANTDEFTLAVNPLAFLLILQVLFQNNAPIPNKRLDYSIEDLASFIKNRPGNFFTYAASYWRSPKTFIATTILGQIFSDPKIASLFFHLMPSLSWTPQLGLRGKLTISNDSGIDPYKLAQAVAEAETILSTDGIVMPTLKFLTFFWGGQQLSSFSEFEIAKIAEAIKNSLETCFTNIDEVLSTFDKKTIEHTNLFDSLQPRTQVGRMILAKDILYGDDQTPKNTQSREDSLLQWASKDGDSLSKIQKTFEGIATFEQNTLTSFSKRSFSYQRFLDACTQILPPHGSTIAHLVGTGCHYTWEGIKLSKKKVGSLLNPHLPEIAVKSWNYGKTVFDESYKSTSRAIQKLDDTVSEKTEKTDQNKKSLQKAEKINGAIYWGLRLTPAVLSLYLANTLFQEGRKTWAASSSPSNFAYNAAYQMITLDAIPSFLDRLRAPLRLTAHSRYIYEGASTVTENTYEPRTFADQITRAYLWLSRGKSIITQTPTSKTYTYTPSLVKGALSFMGGSAMGAASMATLGLASAIGAFETVRFIHTWAEGNDVWDGKKTVMVEDMQRDLQAAATFTQDVKTLVHDLQNAIDSIQEKASRILPPVEQTEQITTPFLQEHLDEINKILGYHPFHNIGNIANSKNEVEIISAFQSAQHWLPSLMYHLGVIDAHLAKAKLVGKVLEENRKEFIKNMEDNPVAAEKSLKAIPYIAQLKEYKTKVPETQHQDVQRLLDELCTPNTGIITTFKAPTPEEILNNPVKSKQIALVKSLQKGHWADAVEIFKRISVLNQYKHQKDLQILIDKFIASAPEEMQSSMITFLDQTRAKAEQPQKSRQKAVAECLEKEDFTGAERILKEIIVIDACVELLQGYKNKSPELEKLINELEEFISKQPLDQKKLELFNWVIDDIIKELGTNSNTSILKQIKKIRPLFVRPPK
ncbi:TPA: hypothetical protein DCW54_01990, partial [Candidatus Dependentiae bacterium]|nr:hypothetical protein [Candidatus Dependentiae bacterium]